MKATVTWLLALLLCSAALPAQDGMENYMALMKPGAQHAFIERLAGDWTLEGKIWQMPGAEATTFEGTAEHRMILGGRFLEMESQSGEGDMYTESLILMGYDNRHKEFTYVGFDTWGTYYVTAKGQYDEEKGSWALKGQDVDPVMGFTQKYQFNIVMIDDDTVRIEVVFFEFPGVKEKEFKMLEMLYTRK